MQTIKWLILHIFINLSDTYYKYQLTITTHQTCSYTHVNGHVRARASVCEVEREREGERQADRVTQRT